MAEATRYIPITTQRATVVLEGEGDEPEQTVQVRAIAISSDLKRVAIINEEGKIEPVDADVLTFAV